VRDGRELAVLENIPKLLAAGSTEVDEGICFRSKSRGSYLFQGDIGLAIVLDNDLYKVFSSFYDRRRPKQPYAAYDCKESYKIIQTIEVMDHGVGIKP
jgi:hypothetical protein